MFIFLIATLISFMNSVELGLVTTRLVSSAERINLGLILLSVLFALLQVFNVEQKKQRTEDTALTDSMYYDSPSRRDQTVTFLIMQCSPLSCYPIPFRPKCLSQHPILNSLSIFNTFNNNKCPIL